MRYPFNKYGLTDFWLYKVKFPLQRAFRGYDDRAYWGLDTYIMDIALPVLRTYKDNKISCPILDGFNGESDFEEMCAEWDRIVEKMILAFEIMDNDYVFSKGDDFKRQHEQVKEGLALFGEHFQSLWT